MRTARRGASAPAALALALTLAACSVAGGGTLGGRERCWPPTEPLIPSLTRGTLELELDGSELATPEGDRFELILGAHSVRSHGDQGLALFDAGGRPVGRDHQSVTMFGGLGDGSIFVCAIETVHDS